MERAVLEAMLAELVRMGRLVRMDSQAAAACSACGHANGCPFVLSVTGVYYALPERVAEPAHCSAERDQGFSKALLDPALHDLSYVNKREVS
jgi:hypothetical protein